MKKLSLVGLLLVICLTFSVIPTGVGAVTTTCDVYTGYNVEAQNYSRWSSTIKSYLSVCDDGTLMRVQAGYSIEGVLVEYYDTSYNLQSTKQIATELPIFGGFYATNTNYFLVTGQTNPDESADVEVFRITKYDKNWTRIASVGLYDCNTTIPFDAGSLRMAVSGNYLLIRTSHEMYTSSDGYNHQANATIQINMETMEITDSDTAVSNNAYGYVSHSFNQFIQIEDNQIVAVDHGDAHPRSIAVVKYPTDVSTGSFIPTRVGCTVIPVLSFPGASGENTTGATVGGFEISDSSYLIAGNSVVQDASNLSRTTRNVFVGAVDKETSEVTVNWITDYEEGDGTTYTPQLVQIATGSYLLLWSRKNTVYYTEIDGNGAQVGEIYSMAGNLSDCVPVVANGKLVWYTWDSETNVFYEIDLSDFSKAQAVTIVNGHQYENTGVVDGYAQLKCTQCGGTSEMQVATNFWVAWREEGDSGYSFATPDNEQLVGATLGFMVASMEPEDCNSEMVFEVSDPSVISYTPDSMMLNTGTITMLQKGEATIKMYPKWNPDVVRTYTFVIDDHVHVYEWMGTENDIATFDCTQCDKQYTETVANSIRVWWNEDGGGTYYSYFSNPKNVGETLYSYAPTSPGDADNSELEVVISDPTVMTYTNRYSTTGYLTMLKPGIVNVTYRLKYNPTVSVTYTIEVAPAPLQITQATLKLENDITVIFKTPVSQVTGGNYHDPYVIVNQEKENGETETQTIPGVLNGDFYEFAYTGVNAKEIGDNLDATVYAYDAENNVAIGETLEDYSVKQYCMNQLAKTTDEQGEFRTLLVDLLNYGSEAQTYFSYKTDALANGDLDETQKAYASADSVLADLQSVANAKHAEIATPTATWKAAGLNLLSKTTIRVKFAYAGDISQVALLANVDGNESRITEFTEAGDGLYYAFFDGITAYRFGAPVDFTVMEGDTAISNTLRYSVESYAAGHMDDESIGEIVSAMIKYGKAAEAYVAAATEA